ncbi:ABC transporter ATP-binding protein [Leptolyngbya sp. FACHB-261]|uniref:ABC transporter ATP-binding protein n=1 Tax=Leptolyngbya sp. FACHB-261 TaxID=2692806 RepID=UPI0016849C35|nr:ABC transporter ATP-binding protein [Leptolyngbya sp. FACHB-261]MBD2103912.1 ABC transporter ATP-binding protein [Leptolyngbya sp. FACHB-261]
MSVSTTSKKTPTRDLRPSRSDWRLLLDIWPYARKSRRLLLISLILLVPLSVAGAIQPLLVQRAIDGPIKNHDLAGLNGLAILLAVTVLVQLAFQSVQGYLVQKVGQQITAAIREDLFAHVLSLSSNFFDRTPVGRLITRLTSDVEALGDVFATGAVGIVSDLFSLVVIAITMFSLRWDLALLLTVMLLPVTGVILYFQQQYRKANYKAREELSTLNSVLQENILGVGVVQIFRRERFNARQFHQINERYVREVDKTIFHDSAVSATLEWVGLAAIAGVLWVGGLQVINGNASGTVGGLTFGTLSAFVLFSQRLFNPLRQLAEKFTTIQAGFTAVERINGILHEPIEIRDPERPRSLPAEGRGEIRFEHVWFAYKDEDYILKDLDFTIRPGEKVALVGPTGAGKSSIIRLLGRLYEATKGRVLIDGVDVRDITQTELRSHVGVILQDGFLFTGDIKDNIALGEPYSLEEVQAAAQRMNVDGFIRRLPNGYLTPVRERGSNLSGGQKQLLAFARAAVRNPRILVLDEATASLDVGTEVLVQEALEKLLEGRTAIIIAHRLSTIRNVDRILVLKQGQLAESGNHRELLEKGGLYASLYKLQMLGQ